MSINRRITFLPAAVAFGLIASHLHAADVVVQPASGSGFVVKDAAGANERLRVQESGVVSLPSVVAAPAQTQNLCMSASGQLGPCSGGGGGSYTAATGLSLTGTTFSVAPTYQLPQTCAANQIAQWNGTAWICGSAGGNLPAGTENQTLRYDAGNALVANNLLQAFGDGGLIAGGTKGVGNIPASGSGVRMMWYPKKAAFRAGNVTATQWDDGSVGDFSVAMGDSSIANGVASIALGNQTTANGIGSVALGDGVSAGDDGSIAMGHLASVESGATYSIALGSQATAKGIVSTAIGNHSIADGNGSTAIGNVTHAAAESALAMGYNTLAQGVGSIAIGSSTLATKDYATAIGAETIAAGVNSTAMGRATVASGDSSTAMGFNVSTNGKTGSFIYGDASAGRAQGKSVNDNDFVVFATGGVRFYLSDDGASKAYIAAGDSAWTVTSDRNAKTAIVPVDGREVLEKVVAMPLSTWRYKSQESNYRHMGPMAQDFHAAFGLGDSDKGISTVDADGVALAAIQGLNAVLADHEAKTLARLDEKDREIAALREEMASRANASEEQIAALRAEKNREIGALRAELTTRVAALESLSGDLAEVKAQLRSLQDAAPASIKVASQP